MEKIEIEAKKCYIFNLTKVVVDRLKKLALPFQKARPLSVVGGTEVQGCMKLDQLGQLGMGCYRAMRPALFLNCRKQKGNNDPLAVSQWPRVMPCTLL